jgi:hypothetical protein
MHITGKLAEKLRKNGEKRGCVFVVVRPLLGGNGTVRNITRNIALEVKNIENERRKRINE